MDTSVTILETRPGAAYKRLQNLTMDRVPSKGEKIYLKNELTGMKKDLIVKEIETVIDTDSDGQTKQTYNLYCGPHNPPGI